MSIGTATATAKAEAASPDLAITAREAGAEIARRRRRAIEEREALDREIALLDAVSEILSRLGGRPEPCPGGCNHSDAEHRLFDLGVEAGERGASEDACPYGAGPLREAWLTGHSVGSINGGDNERTANNRA